MHKRIYLMALFIILLYQPAAFASFDPGAEIAPSKFVSGEIIVKFKPRMIVLPKEKTKVLVSDVFSISPSVEYLNRKYRAETIEKVFKRAKEERQLITLETGRIVEFPNLSHYYKIKFPEDVDIKRVVEEFKSDPSIEYADLNYIRRTYQSPNDPKYLDGTQWGLYKINLNPVGSPESGWNESTGTNEVIPN